MRSLVGIDVEREREMLEGKEHKPPRKEGNGRQQERARVGKGPFHAREVLQHEMSVGMT